MTFKSLLKSFVHVHRKSFKTYIRKKGRNTMNFISPHLVSYPECG